MPPILGDAFAPDPIDLAVPTGAKLPKSRRLNMGGDVLPEVDIHQWVITRPSTSSVRAWSRPLPNLVRTHPISIRDLEESILDSLGIDAT